ncbi:hypothetical protein GCM10007901_03210 [Dyella acidisoli]|uniref:Uncharacterized protein n=1 Tax=Dyella acidisoli TaxID=1867834 RepID=A0ABQ5XLA0_9GAMM|nr:hypothetical protein GCM10007901_03210 [Dyella acidisoli]
MVSQRCPLRIGQMRKQRDTTDQGGNVGRQHARDGTTSAMSPVTMLCLISTHGASTLQDLKE